MMLRFPLPSESFHFVPLWTPRDAFRGQDPGSQLALGVGYVPNLSPSREQNFSGTAPLLARTSWPSPQVVFWGGVGRGVGGGEVATFSHLRPLLSSGVVLGLGAGGAGPGRPLKSWSRLSIRAEPRPPPRRPHCARGRRVLLACSCGRLCAPVAPGLPAPGEGVSPGAARRLSAALAAWPPVCDVGDNGPG